MLGEPEGPEGPEGPGGREELNGERIHPGAGEGVFRTNPIQFPTSSSSPFPSSVVVGWSRIEKSRYFRGSACSSRGRKFSRVSILWHIRFAINLLHRCAPCI